MDKSSILSAGIDTAKATLDIAVHGRAEVLTVDNDAAGWQQVAAYLTRAAGGPGGGCQVGIEATGGYERGVIRTLQAAGFPVMVLQPMQVRSYGRAHLRRAKTDRIDAQLIAGCTSLFDVARRVPPDLRFDALGEHLTVIEQIEEDLIRARTRAEHITLARLRQAHVLEIARLEKRRARELARLLVALRAYPDLARRLELVESIPAIGTRTALAIVIRMPELGQISREEVAALAGLAPFVRQSGTFQGKACIGGGRGQVRRALYMPSVAGAHFWNPALQALYQRLIARGKPAKLALIACARKLLIFANTVVQRGTPWVKHRDIKPAAPA